MGRIGASSQYNPEDERLGVGANFLYGLQHVLTMYGGIVAVPLIIGQAAGLEALEIGILIASGLFIGGIATLLQSIGVPFLGAKLPIVQGVSFANVATLLAIISSSGLEGASPEEKMRAVIGAVLVAAAVGLVIAPLVARLIRFFPAVVTGTVIAVTGLSLMRVAGDWVMGGASAEAAGTYGNARNIALAGITLGIVLLLSKVRVAVISRMSVLIGIIAGTIIAIPFGMVRFEDLGDSAIMALPNPFMFGMPTFSVGASLSMLVVVLVIMVETTAMILALGEIIGTKVDQRRIANGLRADMVSSVLSPILNSFTQSGFAQNIGLVAITRVKSRYVVAAGGAILIVLGLFPVVGSIVALIPSSVLGGAGVVLFGSIASAGIRTLGSVNYDGNLNLVIVAVGVAVGVLPEVTPGLYGDFPPAVQIIFGSGISSAAIFTIILNLLFNHFARGASGRAPESLPGTGRVITDRQFRWLKEGDYVRDGKLHTSDGEVVPVVSEP